MMHFYSISVVCAFSTNQPLAYHCGLSLSSQLAIGESPDQLVSL